MGDRPAGSVGLTTMQVQLLLQLRELVQTMESWTLGHAQYLRATTGGSPIVIMPFVFLTKDRANIEGNYWDTGIHGAPEWACDIVGFNEVPSSSLDDRLKRLATIGIEEVLVVTVDQTTPQLQVWRRDGTILRPQQPSARRAFSELLQVWFVGQNDGTVRLAFGDDGEFLVPTWDEFSLEPSPYAESPVEHARAAARQRLH